jgi:hypothetical protein
LIKKGFSCAKFHVRNIVAESTLEKVEITWTPTTYTKHGLNRRKAVEFEEVRLAEMEDAETLRDAE